MSEYTIALVRDDQIEETKTLMGRCFDAKYASIFYLHPESTLVVTSNNRVVAGINLDIYQVNREVRMGYIGWLYTDDEHRGNGLAGRLLDEAINFLKDDGCTSLSACVEGDNPASFKQLALEGFTIIGLWQQLKLFKAGTIKVYHHASRFFDMGYFLWHKSLTDKKIPQVATGAKALVTTLLGNTMLFFCCLKGWNLLNLTGLHPIDRSYASLTAEQNMLVFAAPALFLLVRTASMALFAKGTRKREKEEIVYRGWDTAWITALILTFTIGFPFPVPGNVYIKGFDWNLKGKTAFLARMAMRSQVALLLIALFVPKGLALLFGLALVALDGVFSFYPFSGFNASRIKRMSTKTYALSLVITLAVVVLLLVY